MHCTIILATLTSFTAVYSAIEEPILVRRYIANCREGGTIARSPEELQDYLDLRKRIKACVETMEQVWPDWRREAGER